MKKPFAVFQLLSCMLLLSITITSCDEDDPEDNNPVVLTTTGVFVVNEGAFNGANSSISFLNVTSNVMINDIFETINGFPLGDVAQSMLIHKGKGYLVVNNSQKVEVVNMTDFTSTGTITGLQGPRSMVGVGNKGYVCDWFSNSVAVVDLLTNTVVNHISTGNGPEQAIVSGTKLFVVNVGGFDSDSTVTVIDLNSDTVMTTLTVGVNPNSIVADATGKLWVLCGGSTGPDYVGGTADDIQGSLWKINPFNYDIEKHLMMGQYDHPVKLKANKNTNELFYLLGNDNYSGKVIKMAAVPGQLNTTPVINKIFYGLGIDPNSGTIYGGYVPGFTQNGFVFRYSAAGALLDSMEVGIAPNGFVFQSN